MNARKIATGLAQFVVLFVVQFLAESIATTIAADAQDGTPGMPGQHALAISHVTVLDLEHDRRLTDQTVVIRNGKIESIDDTDQPPAAPVLHINASGHYLVPGLAEMHAHIPPGSAGDAYRDRVLFLYLAAGVTTVRGMLGEPSHLKLRSDAANYELLSPRVFTSGPSFNGRSVSSPESAQIMARQQHAAGYDFLKLHPGLERDQYDALVKTADKLGIPFAGHVSIDVGMDRTLQAHQATIDHLDGYMQALVIPDYRYNPNDTGFFGARLVSLIDEKRIDRVARATADAGVWNVATQTLIENFVLPEAPDTMAARPEMRFMPPSTVQRWKNTKSAIIDDPDYDETLALRFVETRRRLILALHDAGAPLLLGSDAPQVFNVPGFAIHRELAALVQAGLTPREALLTGTLNPAVFFDSDETFGSIRPGLEADLVLLEADPTQDIANIAGIAGVVARGRWLPAEFIADELEKLAQP